MAKWAYYGLGPFFQIPRKAIIFKHNSQKDWYFLPRKLNSYTDEPSSLRISESTSGFLSYDGWLLGARCFVFNFLSPHFQIPEWPRVVTYVQIMVGTSSYGFVDSGVLSQRSVSKNILKNMLVVNKRLKRCHATSSYF